MPARERYLVLQFTKQHAPGEMHSYWRTCSLAFRLHARDGCMLVPKCSFDRIEGRISNIYVHHSAIPPLQVGK